MNKYFDFITELQYQNKTLKSQVKAFRSGEKYSRMKSEFKQELSEKNREARELRLELDSANCRTVTVRQNYQQVIEDMEDAHKRELAKKDRELKAMEKRALNAERQRDEALSRCTGKIRELYQVRTELEEEKGKNLKLRAQINRDHENSSVPSSMKLNHKKISNNREKTGRKPGGQPGHKGHPRRKQIPTAKIYIPAPKEYSDSPDYKPTGNTITKQLVGIRLEVTCTEYSTPEFRHIKTRQRVHAEFPEGVVCDVNYDGSIKAFAFLLNNYCNVAVVKVSGFLSELTGGRLRISAGMISGLSKAFSLKSGPMRKKAFADMLLSPVMNTDFTSARVDGKRVNVAICASEKDAIYFARKHKGHAGVKGTPVEDFQGAIVHDHDKTFYSYGSAHQECLDHPLRYLKNSMDNEPTLKWNKQMRELLREMIHFRKGLDPDDKRNPDKIDPGMVKLFENRYDEILLLAKDEYEYEPPSKYFMDGFNLYKKMSGYRDSHLLFLHNRLIPHSNSLSERLLRIFKRKQHQVMAFRSFSSLTYLCDSLGVIASLRNRELNLYESAAVIFDIPTD
jgi:hypothetical protein